MSNSTEFPIYGPYGYSTFSIVQTAQEEHAHGSNPENSPELLVVSIVFSREGIYTVFFFSTENQS